jgi:hypothetical protein
MINGKCESIHNQIALGLAVYKRKDISTGGFCYLNQGLTYGTSGMVQQHCLTLEQASDLNESILCRYQ